MTTNQTIDGVPRRKIHNLKIHVGPFNDLVSGAKTGEVRKCDDRDFQVGDRVELFLVDDTGGNAIRSIVRDITHIQRGYGLPDDVCVLSYGTASHPQGVPVERITLQQVLKAYDYAESHPHKYLRGTTNWCAAVAYKLNACLDEVTRLNTGAVEPAPKATFDLGKALETLAKQVYDSWESQPGFVPWVDGGNSTKQDEARQIASRVFELALANQVGDLP